MHAVQAVRITAQRPSLRPEAVAKTAQFQGELLRLQNAV